MSGPRAEWRYPFALWPREPDGVDHEPWSAADRLKRVRENARRNRCQDLIMNQLVQAKLKTIDTSKGFILDGYPATKGKADFLASLMQQMQYAAPLVQQLDVTDSVAKKRLAKGNNPNDREPTLKPGN